MLPREQPPQRPTAVRTPSVPRLCTIEYAPYPGLASAPLPAGELAKEPRSGGNNATGLSERGLSLSQSVIERRSVHESHRLCKLTLRRGLFLFCALFGREPVIGRQWVQRRRSPGRKAEEAKMAQWLSTEFWFYGLQLQNWMPVSGGIILLFLMYNLMRDYRS